MECGQENEVVDNKIRQDEKATDQKVSFAKLKLVHDKSQFGQKLRGRYIWGITAKIAWILRLR